MYKLVGYRQIKGEKDGRSYDFTLLYCLRESYGVTGVQAFEMSCNSELFQRASLVIGDEFDCCTEHNKNSHRTIVTRFM